MPRRVQLVVNPAAGRGRAARLLPAVAAAVRRAGHDLLVTPTTSLEHAERLVAQAVEAGRCVAAMGGDGLVGRVAGAVAEKDGLLAVLPGGRGNDFARAVRLPRSPVAAVALLTDGQERRVDLGRVRSDTGSTAFLGIASVGFDSDVQECVLRSRLPLGRSVYVVAALATVARWQHARFSATVDGVQVEVQGWSFAVADSGRYGGGMRLAPDASLEDGLLDVVTSSATSRTRFLRGLPRVFRGTHVHLPSVDVRRGSLVELDADRPFRVFADGEPVGALPCSVEVERAALRVLLPSR